MQEQFDLFGEPEEKPAVKEEKKPEPPVSTDRGKQSHRVLSFEKKKKKSADEVGGWGNIHLMKLAVGVVWDSLEQKHFTYLEDEAGKLIDKLKTADLVVGFNVIGFDYTVLQPESSIDLHDLPTFDMLVDVKQKLGFRLSLDHLAGQTLNAKKSADGLTSLKWYKEGKIDQIVEYCIQDVNVTRDLFLFGEENGFVRYLSRSGKAMTLDVDWKTEKIIGK